MDPISFIALCAKAEPLQQGFIHAWPAPFQMHISNWWHSAPSAKRRRNFIRTLIPIPLYNYLLVHMGLPKKTFCMQLATALKERRKQTTVVVNKAKDWLIDNPLQFPLPPAVSGNLWNMTGSPMGIISTQKRRPEYHEPEPLPAKVTKKSAMKAPKRGKQTQNRSRTHSSSHLDISDPPKPFYSPELWNYFQLRPPAEPPPCS